MGRSSRIHRSPSDSQASCAPPIPAAVPVARLSGKAGGCDPTGSLATVLASIDEWRLAAPFGSPSECRAQPGFRRLTRMSVSPLLPSSAADRRRYPIVGLGSRRELFQDGIETTHAAWAELVAVCDSNPGRIELARQRSGRNGAPVPAGYLAADFDRMLRERRPDVVIVTTPDATHHDYLIRAMDAGCDVITGKPMTTDAVKCRQILETQRRTGRSCRVTFNYRYSPPRSQVRVAAAVAGSLARRVRTPFPVGVSVRTTPKLSHQITYSLCRGLPLSASSTATSS